MIVHEEQVFIRKFVLKDKQERYLAFLSRDKTRKKFTNELNHFNDFNWQLFRAIPGDENERQTIRLKVKNNNYISSCSIISADPKYDGKVMSVESAVNDLIGIEGTILIFGDAHVVYYEGEAPKN